MAKRFSFGPLNKLRVIDAGSMIAGPLAATLLADFGADVIKLELPGVGDSMRDWSPMKDGKSLWWKVIGRNKRLVTLKLSNEEGQSLFKRLIADADILIENFRPGTFERWGLGYDKLSEINPKLVMLRVSGYGQTGPYAKRGGYGTVAEAMSGVPHFTGFPDKPPTLPGFPMADSVAATFTAMSAMFAVYERDQGGSNRGQVIDVSLFEPLFRLVESQVIGFDQLNIIKQRIGNRIAEDSPRNTYRTRDGRWIGISASSQKTFERLVEAMDMPLLAKDPRFKNNASRCDNDEELDSIMENWFCRYDAEEILQRFNQADVVAGPVYDIADVFADPHYAARDMIVDVPDEDFGSVRMQAAVPKFSRTPGEVQHSGQSMGSDNIEVYCEELGLTNSEYERLQELGVI